jgi:hypothetical protein
MDATIDEKMKESDIVEKITFSDITSYDQE